MLTRLGVAFSQAIFTVYYIHIILSFVLEPIYELLPLQNQLWLYYPISRPQTQKFQYLKVMQQQEWKQLWLSFPCIQTQRAAAAARQPRQGATAVPSAATAAAIRTALACPRPYQTRPGVAAAAAAVVRTYVALGWRTQC